MKLNNTHTIFTQYGTVPILLSLCRIESLVFSLHSYQGRAQSKWKQSHIHRCQTKSFPV
uniref:Uncharacterized protein n=1 Tax=Anguilla anguilla TaxID=7936 RepID=A0A0E9S249_ANGAN